MNDIDEALEALERIQTIIITDEALAGSGAIYSGSDRERDVDTIRQTLERQREQVYVVVERNGPDCQFLEIENAGGQGVSIPYAKTVGKVSWIGPLYRLAAAPDPGDE